MNPYLVETIWHPWTKIRPEARPLVDVLQAFPKKDEIFALIDINSSLFVQKISIKCTGFRNSR